MPSHLSADRPAAQPPPRGPVDALISQARRLKGDVDAVRRGTPADTTDPRERWRRALYDLALHQLDDLDQHLAHLRDDPPMVSGPPAATAVPPPDSLLSRVGSAEWNLLTDEVSWSGELYRILGRDPAAPPLTLDELPSLVVDEDRPSLTGMVTGCLVDGRPIDGEFRVLRPGDGVRTVHMMGEPVLGADGSTASMWAVLRDVSELRRCRRAVSETRDWLHHHRHAATGTGQPLVVEPREAVPPPWRGSRRLPHDGPRTPHDGPGTLDIAAAHLPPSAHTAVGGDWCDSLELPDGTTLLGVGDLTGHGVGAVSGTAMLLGAVRGMAMTGIEPGPLLACLNRLLDVGAQPALGSAVCLRYRPATRSLVWAQAGHPAPLLFRGGTGRALEAPRGVPLGAAPDSAYGQAEETLEVGDLLLLHTDLLVPGHAGATAAHQLLPLAPVLTGTRTARDCVRAVLRECGEGERADHACVLVARVAA